MKCHRGFEEVLKEKPEARRNYSGVSLIAYVAVAAVVLTASALAFYGSCSKSEGNGNSGNNIQQDNIQQDTQDRTKDGLLKKV